MTNKIIEAARQAEAYATSQTTDIVDWKAIAQERFYALAYQQALEENERLKAQQPQADTPQATTIAEAARDVGKWLNERPNRPIDLRHVAMLVAHAMQPQAEAVHHKPVRVCHIKDVACAGAAVKCGECPEATPQQAEAVPPGYVLVPLEPTQAMIDAMQSSGWMLANYRAMLAAAQGEKP